MLLRRAASRRSVSGANVSVVRCLSKLMLERSSCSRSRRRCEARSTECRKASRGVSDDERVYEVRKDYDAKKVAKRRSARSEEMRVEINSSLVADSCAGKEPKRSD